MNLFRLLALAAVIWIVWSLFRQRSRRAARPVSRPMPTQPVAMVRCAHCGLHIPRPEAVRDGERYYCSAAHRALGTPPR